MKVSYAKECVVIGGWQEVEAITINHETEEGRRGVCVWSGHLVVTLNCV